MVSGIAAVVVEERRALGRVWRGWRRARSEGERGWREGR